MASQQDVLRGAFGSPSASPPETVAQMDSMEMVVLQNIRDSLSGSPQQADIQRARDLTQMMIDSCQIDDGGDMGPPY